MRLLLFLISRTFWVQLGVAAVLGVVGFVAMNVTLRSYTRHSERIAVPGVVGLGKTGAAEALEEAGLTAVVMDSLYNANGQPGAVLEQDPAAGVEVKGRRNVYLTVYRSTPPSERLEVEEGMDASVARILMDVKGFPFRERYESASELAGLVIRVENVEGTQLGPDDRVRKGEPLVLVIGKSSARQVPLPLLVGMTRTEALASLKRSGLGLGFVRWDFIPADRSDSSRAIVTEQLPVHTPGRETQEGTPVDLTFSAPADSGEAP